ncbi:hypothetical protein TNCV_3627161 [Trichonephila clavipes]|nr:hypothetical protein TNCV_3627161 [Trichonephila clavipes]
MTQKVSASHCSGSLQDPQKSTHVKIKTLGSAIIAFFNSNGILMIECILCSQTANQQYNTEVLKRLPEKIRVDRPEFRSDG